MNTLIVKGHFDAAHKLKGVNSKCKNLHGHTWNYEVKITGEVNTIGMVLDFAILKKWVEKCSFDHKYLNNDFVVFGKANPTAENLVTWLKGNLELERLHFGKLPKICKIRIWETPNSYAEKEW